MWTDVGKETLNQGARQMVETGNAVCYCDGLVDGTGGQTIRDAAIRVESGRIKAVGPAGALSPQAGEQLAEHDFRGLWIAPGLIDEHTHLSLPMGEDGRTYEQMAMDPDELMVLKGVQNLQRNLTAGVISVRDNGARNRVGFILREGIRLGYVPGPRVVQRASRR
jgi:imidazolonepropionase-like amidohydrolase